jgi:hypothetical protein
MLLLSLDVQESRAEQSREGKRRKDRRGTREGSKGRNEEERRSNEKCERGEWRGRQGVRTKERQRKDNRK